MSNVLDGDDAGLHYDKLTAEFDTAEAGADKNVTVTVVGAKLENENYRLPDDLTFVLTGTIEATAETPTQSEPGYKLVTGGKDIVEITLNLADNEDLNTSEKIVDYLKKELLKIKISGKTPVKDDTAVYDAVLLYSEDGINWIRATEENFPAEGVKVTLPYPEGTDKKDYRFSAIHMFTVNMNGHQAGEMEEPKVTLTDDGITMTLTSLSPIALSWVKAKKTSNSSGSSHNSSSSDNSNSGSASVNDTPATAVQGAKTGDSSQPVLWGTLAVFCLMGIWMTITVMRRKREQK